MWDWIQEWLRKGAIQPTQTLLGTGALLDTRTEKEKQQDIHFGEIVATAAQVAWPTKTVNQLRAFPDFDQAQAFACVAFTMAKILGILQFLKGGSFVMFSAGDIYNRRSNKDIGDGEGMNGTDPYSVAAQGVTLDCLMSSQGLTEAALNAVPVLPIAREVSKLLKTSNPQPIVLTTGDIDAVASVIQATGKGVMVWFYFTASEWSQLVPKADDATLQVGDARALRHSVTAVDFFLYGGKKALYIEDSAHFGGITRRIITEDFFKARNWFAGYPMNFQTVKVENAQPDPALHIPFTRPLIFIPWDSNRNEPSDITTHAAQVLDVQGLQTVLQQMGYFPANVKPSGYYGALTAKAVLAWQTDHSVATQTELAQLQGRQFGPASIAEMNRELRV